MCQKSKNCVDYEWYDVIRIYETAIKLFGNCDNNHDNINFSATGSTPSTLSKMKSHVQPDNFELSETLANNSIRMCKLQ